MSEMKRLIQRYCPSLHATHSPFDLGDLVNLFNFALESFTTEKKILQKNILPSLGLVPSLVMAVRISILSLGPGNPT